MSEFRIRTPNGKSEKWVRTALFCPKCGEQGLATQLGARLTAVDDETSLDRHQCASCRQVLLLATPASTVEDDARASQLGILAIAHSTGGTGAVAGTPKPK